MTASVLLLSPLLAGIGNTAFGDLLNRLFFANAMAADAAGDEDDEDETEDDEEDEDDLDEEDDEDPDEEDGEDETE